MNYNIDLSKIKLNEVDKYKHVKEEIDNAIKNDKLDYLLKKTGVDDMQYLHKVEVLGKASGKESRVCAHVLSKTNGDLVDALVEIKDFVQKGPI